jgi:hypothetical protein
LKLPVGPLKRNFRFSTISYWECARFCSSIFPANVEKKTISLAVCALFKELVNHVGKKVQVKGTVLEIDGQKQIPNSHRYELTAKGIKLTNILNAFLAASAENLVKMAV